MQLLFQQKKQTQQWKEWQNMLVPFFRWLFVYNLWFILFGLVFYVYISSGFCSALIMCSANERTIHIKSGWFEHRSSSKKRKWLLTKTISAISWTLELTICLPKTKKTMHILLNGERFKQAINFGRAKKEHNTPKKYGDEERKKPVNLCVVQLLKMEWQNGKMNTDGEKSKQFRWPGFQLYRQTYDGT